MAKKNKNFKSIPSINLKLTEDLKAQIKKVAQDNNQTVSKFIRELVTDYMDGALYENAVAHYRDKAFINSTEFLQLIVLMYTKREKGRYEDTEKQLDDYISTLKKTEHNLPDDLVVEFDIVLFDLMRVKSKGSRSDKYFEFHKNYSYSPGFNYEKLEGYLLNDMKLSREVTIMI